MTKMAKYCSSRDGEFISPKAKIKDQRKKKKEKRKKLLPLCLCGKIKKESFLRHCVPRNDQPGAILT
jgi:hypothetical protein